jgi:hypothetical protein
VVLEFKRGLENEGRGGAVDDEEESVISVVGEEIDELPKEVRMRRSSLRSLVLPKGGDSECGLVGILPPGTGFFNVSCHEAPLVGASNSRTDLCAVRISGGRA